MAKILIVDDEPGILDVLRCWLDDMGYQITTTTKGEAALEMIPRIDPDLVITDIRMSPVDGWQVLDAARKHNPMMAVIMMTGHLTTADDADNAKKLGATDYIYKPFQLADFARRVDIALKSREQLRTLGIAGPTGTSQSLSRV